MSISRESGGFHGLGGRSAHVCETLRTQIRNGVFGPGSRLPTEVALCTRFSVTRPTVRKAVAQLVREGLVAVRAGSGMTVCDRPAVPPAQASRTISVMYHFDADSLHAVQTMAMESGHLLCTFSQRDWWWDPARERQFLEAVKAEGRRALIAFCSPLEPRNDDLLEALEAAGTRVVHIEPHAPDLPGQNYILPDYEACGAAAATELLLAGCRSFAFLPMSSAPFEQLLERGFSRTLATHGPGYDPSHDRFTFKAFASPDEPDAVRLAAFLRDRPRPLGLFCRSAGNAASTLFVLEQLGLAVPRDARVLTMTQDGGRNATPVDQLAFNHLDHVRRAIAATTAPAWRGVRELVKPVLTRAGSVRRA